MEGYLNHLNDHQKKVLKEFKDLLDSDHESIKQKIYQEKYGAKVTQPLSIWNVNLEVESDQRDIILLKFLRAREFKLEESKDMLFKTLEWREEFKVEEVKLKVFPEKYKKLGEIYKSDKQGRPIMINYYQHLIVSTDEEVQEFLEWKVQQMEQIIDTLSSKQWQPAEDIIVIHDYQGVSMFDRSSSKKVSGATIKLLQNNYPETLGIKFFINISWLLEKMFSFFLSFTSARTKSKFIIASGANYREKLLKYIDADCLSPRLGGIPIDSQEDPIQLVIPPKETKTVNIPMGNLDDHCEIAYTTESQDIQFTVKNDTTNTIIYKDQKEYSSTTVKYADRSLYQLIFDNSNSNQQKTIYYKFKIISSPVIQQSEGNVNNNNN
ncbi:cellular retinaldehyde-binding/triple function domain-containing protein [Tieghemostelium lacteum]|uniref:Cellular retinaldehyde-binding/triple function domain-containing protein n=1 Tax=Tieghemostelium lacteum TaxID=361077 RepID=A0A151ZIF0_TIELA|nr:cellular retinaldehyde-binding/triple function domain-containing protein [Tieghemostelium lacteum]|eukprot:KYQ93743.1 cellular retinaldehyde-binding/triple function domain-containing protein [Tieghemostelium lacteum]